MTPKSWVAWTNSNWGIDFSLIVVAIVWGSSYVVMQIVVSHGISVPAFLALRFLFALPIMIWIARRTIVNLTTQEVTAGAFFGLLLFGILTLETIGVQYTTATNAGFIISTSVVIVPIFEGFLGGFNHSPHIYAATVISLLGCGILILSPSHISSFGEGDLVVFIAAIIRGFQIALFGRYKTSHDLSIINITLIEFVVVTLLALAWLSLIGFPLLAQVARAGSESLILIAYLGILGTAYAFLVQLHVARMSFATRVGIILSTEPLFAGIFGVLIRNNHLLPLQVLGGGIIIISILSTKIKDPKKIKADIDV